MKVKRGQAEQLKMAINGYFILGMFALVAAVTVTDAVAVSTVVDIGSLNRSSFPAGFIFGAGSSAYQVYIYIYSSSNISHHNLFFLFFLSKFISQNHNIFKYKFNFNWEYSSIFLPMFAVLVLLIHWTQACILIFEFPNTLISTLQSAHKSIATYF